MTLPSGVLTEGMKQAPALIVFGALVWMFLGHIETSRTQQQGLIERHDAQIMKVTEQQDATNRALIDATMDMGKVLDRCERTLSKFDPDGGVRMGDRGKPSERLATLVEPLRE